MGASVAQEPARRQYGAGHGGSARVPAARRHRSPARPLPVHRAGLPAGAGSADAERAGGGRRGADPDAGRVFRAGRRDRAAGHDRANPGGLNPGAGGGRRGANDVRRAHQPGADRWRTSCEVLRRQAVHDDDPAQHPAGRGAQPRQAGAALRRALARAPRAYIRLAKEIYGAAGGEGGGEGKRRGGVDVGSRGGGD